MARAILESSVNRFVRHDRCGAPDAISPANNRVILDGDNGRIDSIEL